MSTKHQNGLTYWEVSQLAHEIGRRFGQHIRFTIDLPVREGTGKAFTVRCAAWASDGKGNWYDRRGVSEPWPHTDARTFVGLLYRLLMDLEDDLTAEEASAATRQLPLWGKSS